MTKDKGSEKKNLTESGTDNTLSSETQDPKVISLFDPSRENVGKIYRDAQLASHDAYVENGDLTRELMKSLVIDLNEAIASDPFNGQDFYITVHEKKDAQMQRAIHRRLIKSRYRPWPEDDTIVYHVYPNSGSVFFCWCLPHHSEMANFLENHDQYDPSLIRDIKAYKAFDLLHFGFVKTMSNSWQAYPGHKDRRIA